MTGLRLSRGLVPRGSSRSHQSHLRRCHMSHFAETNPCHQSLLLLAQSSPSGWMSHKDSITIAVLPAGAKTPTRLERLPNDLAKLKKWLARGARGRDPRLLRGQRRGVCAAPRVAKVGLCVRRHCAVSHSETARRVTQARHARQARRDGSRPPASGRRARGRPHPHGSRRARPRRRALPRNVSARDPQVAPLHPEVPGAPRLRVS